jgi:hypothetical protein
MNRRAFLAPLAICALALSATVAHADSPEEAGGTWAYDPPQVLSITTAGQTTFIDAAATGRVTGTLTGDVDEAYTVIHHAKALFNTYRGVAEFDGVVFDAAGVPHEGTLKLVTHGRQDPGLVTPSATPWTMRWVIVESGGGLGGVSGHGTGEIVGLTLAYEGHVHFAGH